MVQAIRTNRILVAIIFLLVNYVLHLRAALRFATDRAGAPAGRTSPTASAGPRAAAAAAGDDAAPRASPPPVGPRTCAIRAASVGSMRDLASWFEDPRLSVPKARELDFRARHVEILSDPSNLLIPRCRHAGRVFEYRGEEVVVMANGVLVTARGYYGGFSDVLASNLGVHEAAEERVISAIFDRAPPGAAMVELGAYWAFYTAWFLRAVSGGRAWCVESDEKNREVGRKNLALNGVAVEDFSIGFVKTGYWKEYAEASGLPRSIYCILIDIQEYEKELVPDLVSEIAGGSLEVGYIVVGTHAQAVHEQVLSALRDDAGLRIVAALDYDDDTFFCDGMVVATSIPVEEGGLPHMKLGSRVRTPVRKTAFSQPMTGEDCEFLPPDALDQLPPADNETQMLHEYYSSMEWPISCGSSG